MDQEDENISLLLNMGFPDVRAIKRALKLSNGDVNEAVIFLTEQPLSSYTTVDDLRDVEMTNPALRPPSYDEQAGGENGNSMEFPATNLYELESRVFTDTWSIPYKREESLGKCLVAAARLAEEGLCDVDESCHRFMDRCLPECFHKLLANGAVRRWGLEIQEGVFNMLDLLTNLVIVRLKHGPVPEALLKDVYALAMDSKCEWNQKNKHRPAEYTGDTIYAESTSQFESCGWLMDLINIFGNRGGFELIAGHFSSLEELDAGQMAALLLPVGQCAKFLVRDTVCPILLPAITQALQYVANLEEKQLKGQKIGTCYDLLEAVRLLCVSLWPEKAQRTSDLRVEMIIRMLKTPHFSARMNALKELARLIEDSEKGHDNVIDADIIQEWMTSKRVLSLALEGNIDQVQYTDRMKELVEFMGPKLQEEELTRIWHMAEKASAHVVDNIHRIMAAAASRFNPHQFQHLLTLVRKSWDNGNDRLREKLLTFIGKIGQDSRLGRTADKMLDSLWELARVPALPPKLVHQAMNEHLNILNESATRDQLRKVYIVRCVEDIKRSPAVYLPLKQLHYLAQSITKGGASYFKTEKATLSELNRSHEIVKLITLSLGKCHALAVSTAGNQQPSPSTLIDGKYTHDHYLRVHLEFLQFLLKEGDIYLAWPRCKDIWDTLVANPKASGYDKETCFNWFSGCLGDLESSTQRDLFCEKLLRLDPVTMTRPAFACFVDYFHAVNLNDHKLIRSGNMITVDKLDPLGMEFIWQLVLECQEEQLAEDAMKLLLDMSYMSLSARLKRDPPQLHAKFISECYRKLEKSMLHVNETAVGAAVSTATKTLTAMAVSDLGGLPSTSRNSCIQHIRRVLVLAERYVSCIEEQHPGPRSLPPHGASFTGTPVILHITCDSNKMDINIECHSNEHVGSVRGKIASYARVPLDQVQTLSFGDSGGGVLVNGGEQDSRLLHHLGVTYNKSVIAKINITSAAQLKEVGDNWDELPGTASYCEASEEGSSEGAGSLAAASEAVAGPSRLGARAFSAAVGDGHGSRYNLDKEKQLPGVVMASQGRDVFSMLYQLAQLDEPRIVEAVRRVLYLVPTDPSVADKFDSICSVGIAAVDASPRTTPYGSPAKRDKTRDKEKDRETGRDVLRSLLDLNATDMTPFRLLYNMEVLSGKIMPISLEGPINSNAHFCEEFLMCGGLSLITALLQKDSLPQEVDYEIRQNVYLITLQILRYLLCGSTPKGQELPVIGQQPHPGPPKRSALDSSAQASPPPTAFSSLTPIIANRVILRFSVEEWSEMVSSLMRVSWAGAAGKLYLSSATMTTDPAISLPENCKSSRQSSTGSAHSSSSDSEGVLQCGVCVQQGTVRPTDSLIASQALHLLVACLRFRPQLIDRWYEMINVKDFIVEVLVGCGDEDVREVAYQQFTNLITMSTPAEIHPKQFLSQVLLKAPLPLWVPSTSARGATLKLLSQCTQYFSLRSKLLSGLSARDQESLGISVHQMLEDEIGWLTNFNATREAARERPESGIPTLRSADNVLLAGHLTLITALLSCEGINKEETGATLIPILVFEYLFPASKLVMEGGSEQDSLSASRNYWAKCTGKESRLAAYQLLVHLVTRCERNLTALAGHLVSLHHTLNPDSLKEFEYAPAVDGRCASGYVGLKNGGATCYMNSVLQHLFLVPGVPEDILAVCSDDENEDSLFYQLQTVFGHLMESQLQYYVPDKFWKCFRMDGQPVNVREQQDAFEFYTRLTEQVDDYLKSGRRESVFAQRFEGVYSIQRICQDCPHRYEREEPFLALNLTVTKCHDLQDSLDQFIKGELLEGDNAYFCEKCSQKRTALIRTCVKSLPPVLVIQLKRFGYDWEASRALKFDDYFKFPWVLDMSAYTAEGLAEQEEDPDGGDCRTSPSPDLKEPLSSPKANTSPSCTSHTPVKSRTSKLSPHTPRINTRLRHKGVTYELVGVIVHSGQASAGHYYSYIKDRRGDPLTNPNKGRWFKFNDTSVEQVEMNDALLEQECFGGTYKAKVSYDSSNPLPEDRLRYWNAYMLVYDSMDERIATPKTPKTPKVGVTSRSFRASTSSARKSLPLGGGSNERRARTSLCELSQLLQQGEKQGMFREHMPPRILSAITHENLTFFKNRDVFSVDYYFFVHQLCSANLESNQNGSNDALSVKAVYLGMNFLLNTYLRTKDKEESVITQWIHLLNTMVQQSREACSWAVDYFSSEDGGIHIQPLLLECPNKMIRGHFSNLLGSIFKAEYDHSNCVDNIQSILKHLLSLLASDVPAAVKTSLQYFSLLYCYCQQGSVQCQQILNLGGFSSLVSFLVGPPDSDKRRWSSVQAQDFGHLHSVIATLITACDMSPHQTIDSTSEKTNSFEPKKLAMPLEVVQVLYGEGQSHWLKEAVMAYKEIPGNIPQLTMALKAVATQNASFTSALLTAVMTEYAKPPSNILKELSQLIIEMLNVSDSLQSSRTTAVLEGFQSEDGENIMGLLDMIGTNKDYDSRRAYQCIKLVVSLSARCPLARDHLTRTQARWQWAVEWLRGKMDDHSATISAATGMSNEDSNTKNFQRTTSAQLTLEEATALLSELESTEMEIECDPTELGDIKESVSEHDASPSQDLDGIDP